MKQMPDPYGPKYFRVFIDGQMKFAFWKRKIQDLSDEDKVEFVKKDKDVNFLLNYCNKKIKKLKHNDDFSEFYIETKGK